ncbi:MAG TPA: hypothetical protein VLV78_05240 [Thermoanaerobaculia bacterium]|nr:hypothetical protein [Thermoanaerobaculia bacterium]
MRALAIASVALLLLTGTTALADRSRFIVRCIEERQGARHTLYEADIDGPSGTDFVVRLRDRGFTLVASFVNEPTASGTIDVRASLTTRRREGTSRNGLPLWEEDVQEHRFTVRYDQEIEILPFGGAGAAGLLKFDVRPVRSTGAGPLRIDINDVSSRGVIEVDAFRQPHWYTAEAEVVSDGRVVARGSSRIFTGVAGRIALPSLGDVTITPRPLTRTDVWRYTEIAIGGRLFPRPTRAVQCRDVWSDYPIDSKTTLRIRVAPAEPEPTKGECS